MFQNSLRERSNATSLCSETSRNISEMFYISFLQSLKIIGIVYITTSGIRGGNAHYVNMARIIKNKKIHNVTVTAMHGTQKERMCKKRRED